MLAAQHAQRPSVQLYPAQTPSCSYTIPERRPRGRPAPVRDLHCKCRAVSAAAELESPPEVTIRRIPPAGIASQPCGPVAFQVPLEQVDKPSNILEEIVWWKASELVRMRELMPMTRLTAMLPIAPKPRDFIGALRASAEASGKPALIAEVKKASPSRGVLREHFDPVQIAKAYEAGGASCLSVLTDSRYFQGSFDNLTAIRKAGVACPLLCKEFIVEAYQLFRARVAGADAALLIAAVLPNKDLTYLTKAARKVGLQCLIEVHSVAELQRVLQLDLTSCMLGINNRNLETFEVKLEHTDAILSSPAGQEVMQRGLLMAGESGIFTPDHRNYMGSTGCQAILVGESLVKADDPCAAVQSLLA